MKNIVEHINNFLSKKSIIWRNKAILDAADGKFVAATDEDFSNNEMQSLKLVNSNKFNVAVKQILINENLFLVFDAFGSKLEKDFSNEWKNYLANIKSKDHKIDKEVEEKVENFNAYLEESIDE